MFLFVILLLIYLFLHENVVLHRLKNNQENGFKTYRCPCILIGRHEHKWLKLQAHYGKLWVLWDMKMQSIMRNFMISKCHASRWAKTSSRMLSGRWLCGQISSRTPSKRDSGVIYTLWTVQRTKQEVRAGCKGKDGMTRTRKMDFCCLVSLVN